jgi:hypothetical protein
VGYGSSNATKLCHKIIGETLNILEGSRFQRRSAEKQNLILVGLFYLINPTVFLVAVIFKQLVNSVADLLIMPFNVACFIRSRQAIFHMNNNR